MAQKVVVDYEKSNDFQEVTQKSRRNEKSNEQICVQNSFTALDGMMEEPVVLGSVHSVIETGEGSRRGDSPVANG